MKNTTNTRIKSHSGLPLCFIYFTLTLSIFLVFWQTRNFPFITFDDNDYVSANPHVLNGLTTDGFIWAFNTGHAANWHPLTWLSLMLDCQLFGPNPGRLHIVNVFLHLASTLLLFAILKKMTGSLWPSAFVAAAFALHPMHVESVAWIAERKDVLSTFLLLLTLSAYAGYAKRPSVFRYMGTLVLFALGLMAKPMLVTLPFLLLLLDYWPLNRFAPANLKASVGKNSKSLSLSNRKTMGYRIFIEKIPFFILAAVSSVITFMVQRASGAVIKAQTFPLQDRAANAFISYIKYIRQLCWPQNMAVFYPLENSGDVLLRNGVICILVLLVISAFVLWIGRNYRYLTVGWLWFLGTLVPVIGFVQVGGQSMADRYTYIPYIGLFIMIAWGVPQLLSKWPHQKIILGISMVVVLTALGVCAHTQTSYWNNSINLFTHAIQVTQNNHVAYQHRGGAYVELGRWQEAVEDLSRALRIKPDAVDALNDIGIAFGELGRYQEEIEVYKQAIQLKPNFAEAYNNLGAAYIKMERYQEAIDAFKKTIAILPDFTDAYYSLGIAYLKMGRYPEMIEAFKQITTIKPDYAEAHFNIGLAYAMTGNQEAALKEYEILKTLNAEMAKNLYNMINK